MTDPNDTIRRFGHPETLVADYEHWVVLLRPEQPTLGSLVLAAKGEARAFGALPPSAHAELARVTADLERALAAVVRFEKLNYLMLMMVDPHVHFHVIPRYEGTRERDGVDLPDRGWPKPPELGSAIALNAQQIADWTAWLKEAWPV
jgi:diadenosine tetraphosphate (Ap4A) HIT family hydrolase